MAIESVCYTAFPPCIAEGNQPRPRQICQPDCLTLEQRCSSTITAAKMHPLIGPDLFPQCMSLPGPSSPTSRSCVTLGFPTRSVTHRQRVQVHVDNVPLPPARMTVNPIGRNPFRVRISWTPSPQETTKVLGYVVERHSEGGVKSQEIPFPKRSFDTGPLERGQSYQFSLRAKNEAGMSQPITARLTIPDGVPSAPPIKFTVTPAGNRSVRLSWRPPLPQHRNGKIVSYQGLYYAQRNPHAVQYFTTRDMSYTLTNLLKSTNYVFQIQALTSVGRGPWSNRQVIRL